MTQYVYLVEIREAIFVFTDLRDAKDSIARALSSEFNHVTIEQEPECVDSWRIYAGTGPNRLKPQGFINQEPVLYGQQILSLPAVYSPI
jgi:hypothetical protein